MSSRIREESTHQLAQATRALSIARSSTQPPQKRRTVRHGTATLYRHTPAPPTIAESSSAAQARASHLTLSDGQPSSQRQLRPRRAIQGESSSSAAVHVDSDVESTVDQSGTYSDKRRDDGFFAEESEPNADGLTYCMDLPIHWPLYLRQAPTNEPRPRTVTKVFTVVAKHVRYRGGTEYYLLKMWGIWVRPEHAWQYLERDDAVIVAVREFSHGLKVLIDWELTWSCDVDQDVVQSWREQEVPRLFIRDNGKGVTTKNRERLTDMGTKMFMAQVYGLPVPTFDDFFNAESDHGEDYNSDEDNNGERIPIQPNSVWKPDTLRAACEGMRSAARGKRRAIPAPRPSDGEHEAGDARERLPSPQLGHIRPTTERPAEDGSEEHDTPSAPASPRLSIASSDLYGDPFDQPPSPPAGCQSEKRKRYLSKTSKHGRQQDDDVPEEPKRKKSKTLPSVRSSTTRTSESDIPAATVKTLVKGATHVKETPVPLPASVSALFARARSAAAVSLETSPTRAGPSGTNTFSLAMNTSTGAAPTSTASPKRALSKTASSTGKGKAASVKAPAKPIQSTASEIASETNESASTTSASRTSEQTTSTSGPDKTAAVKKTTARQIGDASATNIPATTASTSITHSRSTLSTTPGRHPGNETSSAKAGPSNTTSATSATPKSSSATTSSSRIATTTPSLPRPTYPSPSSAQPPVSKISIPSAGPSNAAVGKQYTRWGSSKPDFALQSAAKERRESRAKKVTTQEQLRKEIEKAAQKKVARERRSGMFVSPAKVRRATRPEGSGSHTTSQEAIQMLRAREVKVRQPPKPKFSKAEELRRQIREMSMEDSAELRDVLSDPGEAGPSSARDFSRLVESDLEVDVQEGADGDVKSEDGEGDEARRLRKGKGKERYEGGESESDPFASPEPPGQDAFGGDTEMRFDSRA